jgi:hypothetical protein
MSLNIEVIKRGNTPTYRPVYIGRPSVLGNPYPAKIKSVQEHNRVCSEYRVWLWLEINKGLVSPVYRELLRLLSLVRQEDGLTLVCWCAPLPCHGDIVKNALIWLDTLKQPNELD